MNLPAEDLDAAHSRVTRVCEVFWDWRHKVMVFTFTVDSALLGLSAWMYDRNLKATVAAPLFLAGILTAASAAFDQRNQQILEGCFSLARDLEKAWGFDENRGPLSLVPTSRRSLVGRMLTYHAVLLFTYLFLGTLFIAGGVAVAITHPVPPH